MLSFRQMLTCRPDPQDTEPIIQALANGLEIAMLRVNFQLVSIMTWKIEKYSDGERTTIRLIGQMQEQHLQELQMLLDASKPTITIDLEELMLVDLEAVRFLGRCQNDGVHLLHCPRYIRSWIAKEQDKGK